MSQTKKKKLKNVANYVAFGVSYDSKDDASESNSLDSEYGICDNESEEEGDMQNAYNHLFSEYSKLKKLNKQHLQKLKEINLENDKLSSTLIDPHAIHDTLKSENHNLIAKVKSLENDLNDSRNHLKTFSNEKLNHMLHNQKHSFHRTGLGFDKSIVSSTNVVSPSKLIFVKPVCKE
jgi:seryl-tRNA synthetase